jgi:single-stranded DNA-binding protein
MKVITLTGNATKDIEIRYRTNGRAIETAIIAARSDLKINWRI